MLRNLLSIVALLLLLSPGGVSQSAMFTKVVTAIGDGNETSKSLISDASGNIYISGTFESTCHFGNDSVILAGSENVFLAKYNPSTGFLWAVAPEASQVAYGEAIAFDNQESVYVTGYFYGNIRSEEHT